jgi:hypothetical protein
VFSRYQSSAERILITTNEDMDNIMDRLTGITVQGKDRSFWQIFLDEVTTVLSL